MLASVRNLAEAELIVSAGVDILDLKQPSAGALGRLDDDTLKKICHKFHGKITISATVGDIATDSAAISNAVLDMSKHDVDIIKVGIVSNHFDDELIETLIELNHLKPIVLVLLVDQVNPATVLKQFTSDMAYGVMLDTADKTRHLLQTVSISRIMEFVQQAKSLGLVSGLAGSLAVEHIPMLLPLDPGYLGFRGALCAASNRKFNMDELAVHRIKTSIHNYHPTSQLSPMRNQ